MSDVTPHELRTIELREAWRGYRQEDVDELLDRVALTLEGLYEQMQALTERVEQAEAEVTSGADLEQMLRRTLMLAQQTADSAVHEAEHNAQKLLEDARAEADALRNSERGRIEMEINELIELRDQIAAHIDDLDQYEREYRTKVRAQLEADLVAMTARPPITMPARPQPPEGVAAPPTTATPSTAAHADAIITDDDEDDDTAGGHDDDAAQRDRARDVNVSARARVTSPRDLDDDTFFASLRDAVTDTAPLGPRDDVEPPLGVGGGPSLSTRESGEAGRFGTLFRRRS